MIVDVPLHPSARELLFRRGEVELYRAKVAPEPPRLRLRRPAKIGKDRVKISWSAKHTASLTFQVLYLTDAARAFESKISRLASGFKTRVPMKPFRRISP